MKKIHILLPALVVMFSATQIAICGDTVRPRHKAVIACFNGTIESRSKCSARNFQPDGTIFPSGGPMRCGFPGKVSCISWKLVMKDEGGDHYDFVRVFPHGEEEAKKQKKRIRFAGKRIVVFKDGYQVIVIDPPQNGRNEIGKDRPESGRLLDPDLKIRESAALKQAMLEVTLVFIEDNDPAADLENIRSQVEDAINLIRKEVPDFLMLSTLDEDELRAGRMIHNANRRISEAEAIHSDIEIELSGLFTSLLSQ